MHPPILSAALFLLASALVPAPAAAAEATIPAAEGIAPIPQHFLVARPHLGAGASTSFGNAPGGLGYHLGGRLLLTANQRQSYGIELTYLRPRGLEGRSPADPEYLSFGVVLEQTLFGGFVMAIGTVGYLGLSGPAANPFGIVTNLGWEPANGEAVAPFVTFRSETLFTAPVQSVNSLSLGVSFRL